LNTDCEKYRRASAVQVCMRVLVYCASMCHCWVCTFCRLLRWK